MKKEIEIENRINSIERHIMNDVMEGCYTDHSLFEQKCWINALEWVLEENEE